MSRTPTPRTIQPKSRSEATVNGVATAAADAATGTDVVRDGFVLDFISGTKQIRRRRRNCWYGSGSPAFCHTSTGSCSPNAASTGSGRAGARASSCPTGSSGNPAAEYIRWWILRHAWVLASVDLPLETFIVEATSTCSPAFRREHAEAAA